jgi:FkbM family methyltransferase
MNKFSRFFLETYGKSTRTTAKVLCNKLVYASNRFVGRDLPVGRLRARWHWYRYPFSLRKEILWSSPLQAWFSPEDESATECMLHMENYEPVAWVAPKKGDIFLDVGGYVGWYSIQAAKAVGPAGKVIVLEPDEINRLQLERNLGLNDIRNVQVLSKAVWSFSGTVNWSHGTEPVWHQVGQAQTGDFREAVSIDDLVQTLGLTQLDWVKLDIEGAEIEAIEGAHKTLNTLRPILFIEVHKTREHLGSMLKEIGYSVEREQYDELPDMHGWILARAS